MFDANADVVCRRLIYKLHQLISTLECKDVLRRNATCNVKCSNGLTSNIHKHTFIILVATVNVILD